jgi:hypothetical protein
MRHWERRNSSQNMKRAKKTAPDEGGGTVMEGNGSGSLGECVKFDRKSTV